MNPWAAAVGGLAVLLWIAVAPPWRDGRRGWLRGAAAALLLLGLLDVGCRLPGGSSAPRLRVLIDRSESMRLAGPSGEGRGTVGRTWLDGPDFRAWSAGWEVEVDSFGGAESDPGTAVERAAAAGPDAILIVTDGRVTGGRSIEPAGVPVHALVPEPRMLPDAAVLELRSTSGAEDAVEVEVAAVGGLPVPEGRVELAVGGRPAGNRALPAMSFGERRQVTFPLPSGDGYAVVTARVTVPDDPVPGNDERSLIREPSGPRRALAVALGPAWEFGPWVRALRRSHPGPVDAYRSLPGGVLRAVDGGGPAAWIDLAPGRYAVAYLIGDPGALYATGRAWIERFLGAGGRGLLWSPAGGIGRLTGAEVTVERQRPSAIPALTDEGRAWLSASGATPEAVPDGGPEWPPLEGLPAAVRPPPGATVLLSAGGSPVAWVGENGTIRQAVLLGTGYYRWPIVNTPGDDPGPAFWRAWTDALARWLSSASPAIRPLVRLAPGRAVPASEPLRAVVAGDAGEVRWRVTRGAGEVARGELAADDPGRAIVTGPLAPGEYRLDVEAAGGRRASEPFVVEHWTPELAWTAADTTAVAAAARRSGGELMADEGPLSPLEPGAAGKLLEPDPRRLRLGTWPWTFLVAAALVLADWALARPR